MLDTYIMCIDEMESLSYVVYCMNYINTCPVSIDRAWYRLVYRIDAICDTTCNVSNCILQLFIS